RAQGVLAAPESALESDQDGFDKLRRTLGYSGFVGMAQSYLTTHDNSIIPNMKVQMKTANEIITRLPDKTPTEVRRDLQSILTLFDGVMQKTEKSSTDPSVTLTSADLAPLYATLPVLDNRVDGAASVNRLAAQNKLQFWAMLLTLVCWASLIIAAATAVGIYLSLRDRNSAPHRALVQSVKNMAHGDMRTSIWGMERSDMIGELARAVDMARYHFSQLPDMSLLSDQGPVRIRFEGNTKSLFEAMMQLITRDSEQVRAQAQNLSDAIKGQQDAIKGMTEQVETVLHNILQRGQDGNQQVKHVLQDMLTSAQSLKSAQEHAADQLTRIVPYLQERAHGISEITQITGKQVAQVLQSLALTERGLKQSAELSENSLKKISANADDLGDRLFGAINLLQASGKVLSETTETTQSRLKEAIERVYQITPGSLPTPSYSAPDTTSAPRLEGLISSLESAHRKLELVLSEQTSAAKAQIDLLTTHSNSLLAQSTTTAQTLTIAADHLRDEQAKFDQTVNHIGGKLDAIGAKLEHQAEASFGKVETEVGEAHTQLPQIAAQLNEITAKLANIEPRTSTGDVADVNGLLIEIKTGFETTVRSLSQLREQMTNMVINLNSQIPVMPIGVAGEGSDAHWKEIAEKIDTTRNSLSQLLTEQINRVEERLANLNSEPAAPALPRDAQEQMEQQTQILTELVATLGVLDAHMQQLKTDMKAARG
ncbi:MAG TPA: hypothetical protein VFR09_02250, partial [Alphaproteobacteria bacterium]|nr:hypothetical protein [Alphaproteobacteria bacterium]